MNARKSIVEAGLRATAARLRVFGVLAAARRPLAVGEIYRRARGGAGMATVYRALASFERVGLARRIHGDDEARFVVQAASSPDHLVCQKCGRVEDIKTDAGIRRIKARVFRESGFAAGDHSLYFYADCRRSECAE